MDVLDRPWTEKYRPSNLKEVIGQDAIVDKLKAFVKAKNFPNMIFSGPAGVGKTTSAIAMARELYGDSLNEAFLELNASDARGIDVIRGRVKEFARTVPLSSGEERDHSICASIQHAQQRRTGLRSQMKLRKLQSLRRLVRLQLHQQQQRLLLKFLRSQ